MKTLFNKIITTGIIGAGLIYFGGCGNTKLKEIPKKEIIGTIIAEYEAKEYLNISENPKVIKKNHMYDIVTEDNDTFAIKPTFTSEDIFNIGNKVRLQTEKNKTNMMAINKEGDLILYHPILNIVSYEILK